MFPVPVDYDELLNYYTHRGYRVIAVATRHIPKLSWLRVQKMERAEAESGLEFVGFIIFENKLKSSTTSVINELNEAAIRNVMCTGDNILTAISVARDCHLIDKTAHCFVPHFADGNVPKASSSASSNCFWTGDGQDPKARLTWESVDNPIYTLNNETLLVRAQRNLLSTQLISR